MNDTKTNSDVNKIPAYSWYALALLTLIYVMNFVDRVLIYLLFAPIKKEMLFTDFQLALLGSTSFVIFYTLMGIPFGRMADRVSRKKLIAFGLTIWSIFSGLTGFANSFWMIFICRMMVGIGEATLGPAALSMISDYFPSKIRATVQAIFSSAIAIGTGVAFFFGGWISDAMSWRFAFYFLGFPGLVLVIVVLFLKEPQRGIRDSAASIEKRDWRLLLKNAPLRYILFGYAFFAVAANSVSMWLPTFFVRTQNLSIAKIGLWIGLGTLIGGLPGTILSGWAADKFRLKGPGGRLRFTSLLAFLCIPIWLWILNSGSVTLQFFLIAVLLGLALSWLGPAAADVNDIAGPHLRGLAIGLYFFIVNAIGYGLGPPLYGKLNDIFNVAQYPEVMRQTLLVSPIACFIAGIILFLGSRSLEKQK
ncbi:MAG: MFS transporter [Ignavibacteriales bacterium]|nr:MAG: MFS transporter [Ignavibacteriales bacterium]